MLRLVWLIPVLPLIGFLVNFLLGRRLQLSERAISLIACGVILVAMLLTFECIRLVESNPVSQLMQASNNAAVIRCRTIPVSRHQARSEKRDVQSFAQ